MNLEERNKQIDEIKRLASGVNKATDDFITAKDFNDLLKIVFDFMKGLQTEIRDMRSFITQKDVVIKTFDSLHGEIKTSLKKVNDRVATIKDGYTPVKGKDYKDGRRGEDADPEVVSGMVYSKMRPHLDEIKNLSKAIKSLEKLSASVEELKSRKHMPAVTPVGGRSFLRRADISSSLDGTTKTFNIGAFYSIFQVVASSHPTALRDTIDYTYSGSAGTITFTDNIEASATLATGQTVIILIAVA